MYVTFYDEEKSRYYITALYISKPAVTLKNIFAINVINKLNSWNDKYSNYK